MTWELRKIGGSGRLCLLLLLAVLCNGVLFALHAAGDAGGYTVSALRQAMAQEDLDGYEERLWQELEQVEGVGQNAAVLLRLIGAMGDRARRPGREEKIVASVDQAGAYFLRLLDGQRTEQLYQLCVDGKGKVLSCRMLSQGQADMTVLSLRQAVENALLSGASGVFLAHNHPSGVALPSQADVQATVQVRDALKRLDIRLIDHIIVADGDYVSMASSGLLR